MAIKSQKCLVIDADVAHAAGASAHPVATACRNMLNEILHLGHRFVSTQRIDQEWRRHVSKFSYQWHAAMLSRSRVAAVDPVPSAGFENAILGGGFGPAQREAMLKDLHLVCAALASDRVILSMDQTARRLFGRLSGAQRTLKRLAWGNPAMPEEAILTWLRSGAKTEKRRCLDA